MENTNKDTHNVYMHYSVIIEVRIKHFVRVSRYRLQALKEPVYSQKEADMAAGMGNYVLKQPDTSFTDIDMRDQVSKTERETS